MSKNHKIGAALTVIALLACATQAWAVGDNYIYTNPGRESTTSTFASAPASIYISTATGETQNVTLGRWSSASPVWTEAGAKYSDTHVLSNVTVTGVTGSTAKLILPNGNPNPGGSVGNGDIPPGTNNSTLLQIYTAGTAAGATPTHGQAELIWAQIQTGFYNFNTGTNGTNGITTTATGADKLGAQRLALLLKSDTKTPTAAKYLAVIKDIAGDINGDFLVNGNDILALVPFLDQTPANLGFSRMTWMEGDINGDGLVNGNDILGLVPYLDLGGFAPGGGSGFAPAAATPPSGGTVPEPSTLALFLVGAAFALLTGLRRLVR